MTGPVAAPPSGPTSGGPSIVTGAKSLVQRLFETRGGNYPAPGNASSPQAKADYVTLLLADSEADATLRFKRACQAFLFSDGRQHIDWTNREKVWRDQTQPSGRLYVTMNYVRPILKSRLQRMMAGRVMWQSIPQSNDLDARDRATTATNFFESRWNKQKMPSKTRLALWMAYHCGVSVFKSFWNDQIGPLTPATMVLPHVNGAVHGPVDEKGAPNPRVGMPVMVEYPVDQTGRPMADEQGNPAPPTAEGVFRYRPGDTDTALRSIFNIRLNPDAWGFEENEGLRWLLDSDIVPIHVVKERWGDRAKNVQALSGAAGAAKNYQRLVKSLQQTLGVTIPAADSSPRGGQLPDKDETLLTEYWERPSALLPQGRLIVMAGSECIFPQPGDEEGLPHGFLPFVPIYDERRAFDWAGRGSCEDLIMPQKVINRQWEAELEQQMRDGIGQWVMWNIPGLSDQITNASGAHIEIPATSSLSNRSIGDVVQKVPPAGFNPSRWRMIQEAKATMFDVGAYHEIQRGQVPPGVDSGVAVQYLQEAENAQFHDPVEGLKDSCCEWARHQLRIALKNYGPNEVRWLPVHRPDLGFLVESVQGSDLPDPDDIDVSIEGFRPMSQAALRAEIKEFMKEGYIDPRQGLMLMDMGRGIDGAMESQTRHYARARIENLALERGEVVRLEVGPDNPELALIPTASLTYALVNADRTPLLLPADDLHMVHIPIHQEIALDNTKPWPIREMTLMHIAEHRFMAMQELQQIAANTQGGKPGESGKPADGAPSQGSSSDQPPA